MSKNNAKQAQQQTTEIKLTEQATNAHLLAEIERLRAENQKLSESKAKGQSKITLKVSEKGAVSVYGLGRWPVTLYASQWTRLLSVAKDIAQFMVDNKAKLSEKD